MLSGRLSGHGIPCILGIGMSYPCIYLVSGYMVAPKPILAANTPSRTLVLLALSSLVKTAANIM